MKEYIDKATIKAEIERLIETNKLFKKTWKWKFKWFYRTIIGRLEVLEGLKAFIDTLEVKEIQEEPVNEDLEEAAKNHAVERYRVTRDRELAEKCKWSFKTGAKWQKHLTDSLEVKKVDLEEEIKEQIDKYYENCNKKLEEMGEDDNDISFLTLDGFARYFFELGLRSFVIEEDSKHIWKPNDKQMKALNAMKRYCEIATSFDAYTQEVVESLYQDLKKLKEK